MPAYESEIGKQSDVRLAIGENCIMAAKFSKLALESYKYKLCKAPKYQTIEILIPTTK